MRFYTSHTEDMSLKHDFIRYNLFQDIYIQALLITMRFGRWKWRGGPHMTTSTMIGVVDYFSASLCSILLFSLALISAISSCVIS